MNDLEVCKRIAEIEDISFYETRYAENNFIAMVSSNDFTGTPPEMIGEYNPLTDDTLCFQLQLKFKVQVLFSDRTEMYVARIFDINDGGVDAAHVIYDKSANKAICLTIIASKTNES